MTGDNAIIIWESRRASYVFSQRSTVPDTCPPMPSPATSTELCRAIVDSVQQGRYPDSEDIVSAPLPPSAFSDALKLLDNARDQVKVCSTGMHIFCA